MAGWRIWVSRQPHHSGPRWGQIRVSYPHASAAALTRTALTQIGDVSDVVISEPVAELARGRVGRPVGRGGSRMGGLFATRSSLIGPRGEVPNEVWSHGASQLWAIAAAAGCLRLDRVRYACSRSRPD